MNLPTRWDGGIVSTNHHDVLGIRPNAGRDEIELAYKGRRSQYHPDRYAQADAETQAWATSCMQQVNAAYTALTNGGAAASEPAPARETKSSTPPPVAAVTLAEALRAHSISGRALERIYIAPNIPAKKLHNALDSYNSRMPTSEVLALLDDTVFGSGKDGLLLTEHHLLIKEAFQQCRMVPLKDYEFSFSKGILYANGLRIRDFNVTEGGEVREFVEALNECLKRIDSTSRPTGEAASNAGGIEQLLRHTTQAYLGEVSQLAQARLQQSLSQEDLDSLRDAGEAGLMVHAIRFTGELPDIVASRRRDPVSREQVATLMSDAVRLELLLYQMVWINATLAQRYGRSMDDLQRDMQSFMLAVMFPVLAIVQDNVLPDIENAREVVLGTPLFAAMERRLARYVDFATDANADQGVELFTCLADPVAIHARSVTQVPGMAKKWARMLADACSPADLRRLTDAMHGQLGDCARAYRGFVG